MNIDDFPSHSAQVKPNALQGSLISQKRNEMNGMPERSADQLAWQREMERQQAGNWFKGALTAQAAIEQKKNGHAPALPSAPFIRGLKDSAVDGLTTDGLGEINGVQGVRTQLVGKPVPILPGQVIPQNESKNFFAYSVPAEHVANDAGSLLRAGASERIPLQKFRSREDMEVIHWGDNYFSQIEELARPYRANAESQSPLNLHVSVSGNVVRLWIGAGKHAAPVLDQLPELIRQLQSWLGQQGMQLESLTYNGRAIFRPIEPVNKYTT